MKLPPTQMQHPTHLTLTPKMAILIHTRNIQILQIHSTKNNPVILIKKNTTFGGEFLNKNNEKEKKKFKKNKRNQIDLSCLF
jgi:hypothetical protein